MLSLVFNRMYGLLSLALALSLYGSVSHAFFQPIDWSRGLTTMNPSSLSSSSITTPPSSSSVKQPSYSPTLDWKLQPYAFSLLPLAPGARRKTMREEIVKDSIWTFDQLQGVVNVNTPVRSTVIKLKEGGLFVYNPVGPTDEYISMMRELEAKHGAVKYIVLGSLGLEHKAFAGPFSKYFKDAKIYLQPGQWSFPINLPSRLFGFSPLADIREIPVCNNDAPWATDLDHISLQKLKFKSVGGFGETAFFHKQTGTLLVTDAVVKIEKDAPAIIQEDPRALLFHARDRMTDVVADTKETRRKGWRRMVLFGLVFYPSGIEVSGVKESFDNLKEVNDDMKELGKGAIPINGGLYPWSWVRSEDKNFKALQGSGLFVAPILSKLILDREPQKVLAWADAVSKWPIKRVIPCHYTNNVKASGKEFRRAFSFLERKSNNPTGAMKEDLALLNGVSDIFTKLGVVAKSEVVGV